MQWSQGLFHAGQGAASAILGGIVVTQYAGHGQIQLSQAPRQPFIPIGKVANHQEGIGAKRLQQGYVVVVPLAMEISGNGQSQHRGFRWVNKLQVSSSLGSPSVR
jgi:hypothetical protein